MPGSTEKQVLGRMRRSSWVSRLSRWAPLPWSSVADVVAGAVGEPVAESGLRG